jgi:hypothetical protein
MDFYLPIAQVQISIVTILLLSFGIGVLSGIFGIGGGFLMTPILIFLGIPATYAVANVANNILGISVSGATTHWYKKTLDYKMGFMIVIGGLAGAVVGLQIFKYLREVGNINTIIALAYVYLLAIIGTLIFVEGVKEVSELKKKILVKKKLHTHYWIHGLPFRVRKCANTNYLRIHCWFVCINHGHRWGFPNGSCDDLFNWNAYQINSRNIFIRDHFYHRICRHSTCYTI